MTGHDIVVIGASAGGVEAMLRLVESLPANLPAAIFVVIHTSPASPGWLAGLLSRRGKLPAKYAEQGELIHPGQIYLAPPDHHMLLRDGWVALNHGPKQHHTRPAVDPLFCTAAETYGPRVVGVVLSGGQTNGALGLLAVKECGGVAMVQDPEEALYPSMPRTAMQHAAVDYVLPLSDLAPTLVRLVEDPPGPDPRASSGAGSAEARVGAGRGLPADPEDGAETCRCPECAGTMRQVGWDDLALFECDFGHVLSGVELLEAQSDALERALWTAARLTSEIAWTAGILREQATRCAEPEAAESYRDAAAAAAEQESRIQEALRHSVVRTTRPGPGA